MIAPSPGFARPPEAEQDLRPARRFLGSWQAGLARALVVAAWLGALALTGCGKATPPPATPSPSEILAQATGYYCGMLLTDHEGPKGQIFLAGRTDPLWFSSVRDAIAFLRLPEEPRDVAVAYVNDMGKSAPGQPFDRAAWVDARHAWFVIDSVQRGGMGAPEAFPFSDQGAAQSYSATHGGRVVQLDDIPDAYVIGPVDRPGAAATEGHDARAADAPHR